MMKTAFYGKEMLWVSVLLIGVALPLMAIADTETAREVPKDMPPTLVTSKSSNVRALWIAHRKAQLKPGWAVFTSRNDATDMTRTSLKNTAASLRQLGLKASRDRLEEGAQEKGVTLATDAKKEQPAVKDSDVSPIAVAEVKSAASDKRDLEKERGALHPPLIFGKVKNGFGEQVLTRHPKRAVRHTGLTITAPSEHRIRNIASGRVALARAHKGYGLLVIIDHGGGWHSLYAHLKMLYVKEGQLLERGDPLGKIGKPHGQPSPLIYFELRKDSVPIDPLGWFDPSLKK